MNTTNSTPADFHGDGWECAKAVEVPPAPRRPWIPVREGPVDGQGAYLLDADSYHKDPAPAPSLSNSIIGTMLNFSPMHARNEHPRLGDPAEPEDDEFDEEEHKTTAAQALGSTCHRLLLGRGAEFEVICADNYRTKAAQAAKSLALFNGKTPILERQVDKARAMAAAVRTQLDERFNMPHAFNPACSESEVAFVWFLKMPPLPGEDPNAEHGIWCRAFVDNLPDSFDDEGFFSLLDLKTTGKSARPEPLGRHVSDMGFDTQGAWYSQGAQVLNPKLRGRVRMLDVFVENKKPYAVSVVRAGGEMLNTAQRKVNVAAAIWRKCLASGVWPGYSDEIVALSAPPWYANAWMEREQCEPLISEAVCAWEVYQ